MLAVVYWLLQEAAAFLLGYAFSKGEVRFRVWRRNKSIRKGKRKGTTQKSNKRNEEGENEMKKSCSTCEYSVVRENEGAMYCRYIETPNNVERVSAFEASNRALLHLLQHRKRLIMTEVLPDHLCPKWKGKEVD